MPGWWVSDILNEPALGPPALIAWVVVVIGSIVLHELAHGWAALLLGDPTPRLAGHMTWNPLVHMGPYSLLAFAVIGITWGAMPVDPSRLRGRYGDALVSVAGPVMNISLGLGSLVAMCLWSAYAGGVGDPLHQNLSRFFFYGAMLNVVLAVFNLVPVLPLDGGRIAASLSRTYSRFATGEHGQWLMLGGFILFFWFGFDAVAAVSATTVDALAGVITSLLP